jgi:outer membrane lipopolysaccharide assembly protein LptE/RlpB
LIGRGGLARGRAPRTAAVAALVAVAAGVACGYRLAGTGGTSVLPDHVRTLVVVPFQNRTTRPEIEQRVTEEVARELSRRGRYQVTTDRAAADAILEGAITSYSTTPVSFSAQGRATRVEAVVTIQATVRDLSDDAVLWSQDGLIFREQFDVPATGEFFDRETVALDDIARGAAGALVTSIFEGF